MKARRAVVIAVLALVVLLPLAALGGFVLLVQSESGERWLEAKVSEHVHRAVQVAGIRVEWEWPPALHFDRIRIANPEWAGTPNLFDATDVHARIEPQALLERRLVVSSMHAAQAEFGLEIVGDKTTWGSSETEGKPSRIQLERTAIDKGHVVYRNDNDDTALDAQVEGSVGAAGVMNVRANGRFHGEPTAFEARLPGLEMNPAKPVQFEGKGRMGALQIAADGTLAGKRLETWDLNLKSSGSSLNHLGTLTGIKLPETRAFRLDGHLKRDPHGWTFETFDGSVGDSDLAGTMRYRKGKPRPAFAADIQSDRLHLDDLEALLGAPPGKQVQPASKVLPRTPFHTERWERMDSDVKLAAGHLLRAQQPPLEGLKTHAVLKDGVLVLDPLDFGIGGGRVTSQVKLDGKRTPIDGGIQADIQDLHLAGLFPSLKNVNDAFGTVYGKVELAGHGNSIGDLLGTSTGTITLAANGGQVSDLLTQLFQIDIAKSLMLLGTREKQVKLRCALAHLVVKGGVATPDNFVIDTTETHVNVGGTINFASERLDLETHAQGKTPSFLRLRSPMVMEGSFKAPAVHPKTGNAVAQGAAAAALAAINPALALAPFMSRGSGRDEDCGKLLAEARKEGAVKKAG